jgi:D-arabinono-1,4-lactone oxidase
MPPTMSTQPNLDPKLELELAKLGGNVPFNPVKAHFHHTWANTFYSRPEYYFQPTSIPEIQKIVTLARRCRKRIVVVGNGHSPSDLTCTSSWMINLDKFNKVLEVNVDSKPGVVRLESGISLHDMNVNLAKNGYTMPNLGSIDEQSIAGAISTGTHGSSLDHGLLGQSITALSLVLSNGHFVSCSATKNPSLFRAALCSLGALGIIVEVTFQADPDFNIAWTQDLHDLEEVKALWTSTLWTTHEYTRVWWLPYLKRAVFWRASRTDAPVKPPKPSFYGGAFGYYTYHNLLAFAQYFPSLLPWVEWIIFGMQYGFKPGNYSVSAVEPAREGLLMDCLYSQYVNEWAIPLSKGPEAIHRLGAWINGDEATARIPFSSKGVWVHCPIEVRVSDSNTPNRAGVRAYLDPSCLDSPTLYLNATLYRPYGRDPPCRARYYEAFEWLMREMGGRPHWAKNFAYTDSSYINDVYADDMKDFMKVREECDPDGMFVGDWHQRNLKIKPLSAQSIAEKEKEDGLSRRRLGRKHGDGVLWVGERAMQGMAQYEENENEKGVRAVGFESETDESAARTPTTSTSEESFDYMAKGEASVYSSAGDGITS